MTTATIGLRVIFTDWFDDRPLLVLFLLPITLSAYLGGIGPGLLATAIVTLGTFYIVLPPLTAFQLSKPIDLFQWLLMVTGGIMVCVFNEILLRARNRAEASEQLQALTLASIGDAVITTDLQGQITFMNLEAVRLTGWPLNEAAGQPLLSVFRVFDQPASLLVENLVETVLRATTPTRQAEPLCLLTREGQKISIEANSAPIKLANDVALGIVLVFRDNTERKRAEEQLRKSEERLRLTLAATNLGIWEWNLRDDSIYWSPECYKLFGQDSFGGTIAAFQQLVYQEDLALGVAATQQAIATKTNLSSEFRILHPDGKLHWLANLGQTKYDEQGQPILMIGTVHDITERKQAEEELRISEERFAAAFNASPEAMAITTFEEGRYVLVNDAWVEVFGVSREAACGQLFQQLNIWLDEEQRKYVFKHVRECGAVVDYEITGQAINGQTRQFLINAKLIKLGAEPFVLSVSKDITERKRAEDRLRASEQHFRALFDGAGVGNVECDAKTGQFLRVNQKMCELTGYTAEELRGLQFAEITHPEDRDATLTEYQQFVSQQIPAYAVEKRYLRKDGSLVWVSVTSSLLLDVAGQPWRTVAAINDITERKRAEAALQLSEERLQLLHQIISNPYTDHAEKINQLLRLGCQQFGLENGVVSKREPTRFEVTYVVSAGDAIAPGLQCQVELTYCQETVRRNDLFELEHAGASDWRGHRAYATYGVETYFGIPVQCGNQIYGTLCFTSLTPRQTPFTSGDRDLLRLMTQWISAELTRQATALSLQESETRFRTLFEQTPVCKAIIDLETRRIVDCNRVATTFLGYNKEELCALSISDVDMLHGPKEVEATLAALKRRENVQFETIYRRKNGELRHGLVVGVGLQIHGKEYGYGSIIDITEKKQAEVALQQERERLEKIATSSPIVILSFRVGPDRVHSYPYVSPAFYELYGVTPQDLAKDPRLTDERVHPDDLLILAESLAVSARTLSRWHHIWRVNHPDKGEIWVEGYGTPVPESDGSFMWHGILNDVTERQRTENALRFEKERLEKMALASPIAMYSFNCTVEGALSLRYASAAYYEILGLNHPGFTTDLSVMFARIPVEDILRIRAARDVSAHTMSVLHETHRYQHPQKGMRWIESYSAPVRESDGSLTWHGVTNDITERKQTEQDLLLTQNQLRHLATHLQSVREEERAAIAREIHDDLGQMLTAMRFNLKWIEQGIDPNASALRERVTNATDLITQTIQIVRRIATSLHPSILDDFGLPAALEWQVNEFQKHSGIRCHIEALPAALSLERNRALALFRICQETLTNVARHAGATEISLSLREEEQNVWLRIHDNGRGIALDALAKRRSLGLISMRERALSLGGEFTVQGAPGNGTTVTVRIPIPGEVQPALS